MEGGGGEKRGFIFTHFYYFCLSGAVTARRLSHYPTTARGVFMGGSWTMRGRGARRGAAAHKQWGRHYITNGGHAR